MTNSTLNVDSYIHTYKGGDMKRIKPPKTGAKILFFDIETAPSKGWFWQMWETDILEVETPGYMLSFAAKWFGKSQIMAYGLPNFRGYHKDPSCDKRLVERLAELINEADIVVAHNGDRFDIITTNTRMVVNGLRPLPPTKSVDTLKVARSKFKFLSNKLDDLGNFLGVGRKVPHTGKDLWFRCMKGDPKAWKTMLKYNKQDVALLEQVYLKLRPWMTNHPNLNVINGSEHACPNCGSFRVQKRGVRITQTRRYQRYWCMECWSWSHVPSDKVGVVIR